MKKNNITSVLGVIGLAGLVGAVSLSAQDATPPVPPAAPPATPVAPPEPPAPQLTEAEVKDISSYILGLQSAQRFAGSGLTAEDMQTESFVKGFLAGLKGDKPEYPEEKLRAAMEALGKAVQDREAKKAEANLAAGNAFLADNAKKEGVITTTSGLQYQVINKGTDQKYVAPADGAPDDGTKFMVHYRGTLIDGTEFDKSPDGEPFPMTLQVIPGFKEALTTMPVGAKWRIFLPANLAYGSRAAGPKIGANSALIFELELVEIQAAPEAAPAPPAPPVPSPARPKASAVTPPVQVPAPKPAENKTEKPE
ncbi:MAG: FKBP-type peptidyl-prolyl cis-trans isomerase [Akkermansiaceae bacterium]|nr:FKBP-type peptidyl-prolyl cis-trans isomerase [Akkermansiaceae bacterium]